MNSRTKELENEYLAANDEIDPDFDNTTGDGIEDEDFNNPS